MVSSKNANLGEGGGGLISSKNARSSKTGALPDVQVFDGSTGVRAEQGRILADVSKTPCFTNIHPIPFAFISLSSRVPSYSNPLNLLSKQDELFTTNKIFLIFFLK